MEELAQNLSVVRVSPGRAEAERCGTYPGRARSARGHASEAAGTAPHNTRRCTRDQVRDCRRTC
jgi:hypothetical protein